MFGGDGEFGGDVGGRQVILVEGDDLLAVFVVDGRVAGAVEDVDFVAGQIRRRVDGALLGVVVGPWNQRGNGRQERRAHAIERTGQRALGAAVRYFWMN